MEVKVKFGDSGLVTKDFDITRVAFDVPLSYGFSWLDMLEIIRLRVRLEWQPHYTLVFRIHVFKQGSRLREENRKRPMLTNFKKLGDITVVSGISVSDYMMNSLWDKVTWVRLKLLVVKFLSFVYLNICSRLNIIQCKKKCSLRRLVGLCKMLQYVIVNALIIRVT